MNSRLLSVALPLLALPLVAPTNLAAASAQSSACSTKAEAEGLHGTARNSFLSKCMTGAMSPAAPLKAESAMGSAGAVTRPSGVDPAIRSKECSQEADRRGLSNNAREAFRLKCLATAAPPIATGTSTKPPASTPANNNLGQLPK